HFTCNAVVTGGAVITNFASDALRERLVRWGHEVVVCPLGQFILAGGAAKCLVLQLEHPGARRPARAPRVASEVRERAIEIQGDLLDTGLMNAMLDRITDGGGDFEIEAFQPGLRHDQASLARVPRSGETFGFMTADASSERRVELAVERIAWEMRRLRERGGKIVVVASPVVIHTGGSPHLARLVHRGYVQALLGGNGLAAHDV